MNWLEPTRLFATGYTMNRCLTLLTFLALGTAACGDREPPKPADSSVSPAVTAVAMPVYPDERSREIIEHMHLHADQYDKLKQALDQGDIWGAMTPAYWLSRHDEVEGLPAEWQVHATGMRKAAFAVESATDIDVARAAAEQIAVHCRGCHEAAGAAVP